MVGFDRNYLTKLLAEVGLSIVDYQDTPTGMMWSPMHRVNVPIQINQIVKAVKHSITV